MKKRIFVLFSVGILLFSLTSCSLARPEDEAGNGEDKLVGVFITTEYLDLFDFEGYFNDHANQLVGGGDVVVEDTAGYQGRIYATLETVTTYDEDGAAYEHKEFVFEGLEGYACFACYIPDGESGYQSSTVGEGFGGVNTHYISGDDGSGIELEGTLYICPQEEVCYYFNPVYQIADHQVYLTSGSGFMMGGMESEGGAYTQTQEQKLTLTVEGEREEYSAKVTCGIEVRYPTQELTVLEMNEAGEILARHSFTPGQFPEGLELGKDCAYLIVEHHKVDHQGQIVVSRELLERDAGTVGTYYLREGDSVLTGDWLNLLWPEA